MRSTSVKDNTARIIVTALLILLVTLMSVSCDMETLSKQGQGKVHLVIVALDYQNAVSVSNLTGTMADAREVGACLESQYKAGKVPFEATYLLAEGKSANRKDDAYPSAVNVISTIEALETNPEDLIVFYYSGHGGAYTDAAGEPNGTGFLACAPEYTIPASLWNRNTLVSDWYDRMIEMGYSATEILECVQKNEMYTELPMDLLFRILDAKDCRAVALIDACYSGAVADEGMTVTDDWNAAISSTLLNAKSYRRLSVLASSTAYQVSRLGAVPVDGSTERHSYFTIDLLYTMGWKHSLNVTTTNSRGEEVYGYMLQRKPSFSVGNCWEKLRYFSSEKQTYTPFFSGMDTVFIP